MKKGSVLPVAVAFGLLLGGPAQAGAPQVLATAPMNSTFGDSDTLFCQVVNVGKKPVDVTFESHDVTGAIVTTLGPMTIAPGGVAGLQEVTTAQYCKFLIQGSKKGVRAHAVYYDSADGHLLLSVPAQ